MIEVKMPQTTDEPQDSLVVFWYKSVGDTVQVHDVLVEVQTEKATFEVEAPTSGVLHQILVSRAETASVGEVLALIRTADDEAEFKARTFVQAPPRIRKLAADLGVDLATVRGTGPNGRITEDDLRAACTAPPPERGAPPMSETDGASAADGDIADASLLALTPTRRTIARRMTESLRESAQFTLTAWAEVTDLAQRRAQLAPGIGWNAWVLRAATLALQAHPDVNAAWEEAGIRQFSTVNLGIAVDLDEGLVVPVLRDAAAISLPELQDAVHELVDKARAGKLSNAELSGDTFTVTNLGTYGVEFFTPILNPPQAAILGVGQVDEKVVLRDGVVGQVYRLPLSLTIDHRVLDGGPAARFLQTVARLLAEPEQLV